MTTSTSEQSLLGIYLNDHLAGAVGGGNLARRLADIEREWVKADVLDRLATEIAEDRAALLDMMTALDVPVRRYKAWAAWIAERAGRLKLNGRLLGRSPLSRILELEALRLGVEGKAAGWRALRARADSDSRLDAGRLDTLIDRARTQIVQLEELRVGAIADVFGGQPEEDASDRSSH